MYTMAELESYKEALNKQHKVRGYGIPRIHYGNPEELSKLNGKGLNIPYAPVSEYSRDLDSYTDEITKLTKQLETNIKETEVRIKKMQNMHNGAKYEIELRGIVNSLLANKLNAIKLKADFASKKDKAYRDDYKISQSFNNAPTKQEDVSDLASNPNTYMTSVLNKGLLGSSNLSKPLNNQFADFRPISPKSTLNRAIEENQREESISDRPLSSSTPKVEREESIKEEPVIDTSLNDDKVVPKPVVDDKKEKEALIYENLDNIYEQVKEGTYEVNPIQNESDDYLDTGIYDDEDLNEEDSNLTNISEQEEPLDNSEGIYEYTNALGQTVTIADDIDGHDDFIDTGQDQDLKKAYENIKINSNPNVEIFFKYNPDEDMGYLMAYDTEKMIALPEKTVYPIKMIYPWEIDTVNNVVATYLEYTYPLLITKDPTPEHIKREIEMMKERENE